MVRLRTLRALGAIDTGSVLADPMLRWLAVVPLMAALAIRALLPTVAVRVSELAGVDLGWIVAPLSGYAVVGIAPLIAGAVVGFLLLDQRDDRTLLALRVTPLPLGLYLTYRLAAPTAAAIVVTLAAIVVAGGQGLGPGESVLAALTAAPLAPLAALALAAFARNKVQGAALMKAASLVLMAPLAGLFIDYGHAAPGAGDTQQAIRFHRFEHPLCSPGEADLTVHMDFAHFRTFPEMALEAKVWPAGICDGPVTPGEWLGRRSG